jgi:hypothetical protein
VANGLYAAGLTVRDIQAHLLDLYGLKVAAGLIGRVTAAVLDEVRDWQSRALDRMSPIVIFDGAKWLITQDNLIAVIDGLKGFPEAITAEFPDAMVQTCVRYRSRTDGDHLTASGAPFPELRSSGKGCARSMLRKRCFRCRISPTLFSDPPHLERPQGSGRRSAPDLQRPDRRYGRGGTRCLRGETGRTIRLHRPGLAQGVAGGDPVSGFDPAIRGSSTRRMPRKV